MTDLETQRRARGLLQREVARAVGVDVQRIRRLEWGLGIRNEAHVREQIAAFFARIPEVKR